MDSVFKIIDKKLLRCYDSEKVLIEPWGENSLRVRATYGPDIQGEDWALLPQEACKAEMRISDDGLTAFIANGKIKAEYSVGGKLTFSNDKGEILLQEYYRKIFDGSDLCSLLNIPPREFMSIPGGDFYTLTLRFESDPDERIYGMGQYQQPYMNMKNCTLELAQRNSQASVPFALSSLGYGFLWNNPAIGMVTFGKNVTEWVAKCTKQLDYWITAGDSPAEIEQSYAKVTGVAPMMPDYGTGFWQCKLRYQTQYELIEVAREYKRRGLPISVIIIDYFHWPKQGDFRFDPEFWPDPDAMIRELKKMGIELMVSIWPTVDKTSENYEEMLQKGYLARTDRGIRFNKEFYGNLVYFDPTNPEAREYVWGKVKKNYYDKGIKAFWLDVAEPESIAEHGDNVRYHKGHNMQVGNIYPLMYARTFFDGMTKAGQKNVVNLIRCAWAGSQRYGALAWSGDVASSFHSFRVQVKAGLNMGIAGLPWWNSDIGGFFGGDTNDPKFRELLIRWFQYGAFCPVFRLHGYRMPCQPPMKDSGSSLCRSGAPNEVWSFGDEAYEILKKYMFMRERLRPYISGLMKTAHENGTPPMRPLFYDFPDDKEAWNIEEEYMFGPDILVAPVLYEGARSVKVYLPAGAEWQDANIGRKHKGGQCIECGAPLDTMPLFLKNGADLLI